MSLDTATKVANLQSLQVLFGQSARNAAPYYPQLCLKKTSDGSKETYGIPGAIAGMREWLGDRIWNRLAAGYFDIVNRHFEWSHAVDRDDYDDDRFGLYETVFRDGGAECAHHPDELLFYLINNGGSLPCWDGQYFFDTDHSWGESGTLSNALTYNASDHTAVTSTECKRAYQQVRKTMLGYKNDKGKLLNRPTRNTNTPGMLVLCPLAIQDAMAEAVDATIISNTSNIFLDRPAVVGTSYLTDDASFYVFHLADAMKPIIFQARQPLKPVQFYGIEDRRKKEIEAYTDSRYDFGFYAWWKAVKMTFN